MEIVKYRLTIVFMSIVYSGSIYGQNLVKNPSFETYSPCGGVSMFGGYATDWIDPWINLNGDTCSTADWYRSSGCFGATPVLGPQTPLTGSALMGFITYSGFSFFGCAPSMTDDWREYAEGELTAPLVAGETYCISFNLSLADQVKWASNKFGVRMSNSQVNPSCASTASGDSDLEGVGILPQMEYTGFITNTTGWEHIEFDYVASGGEQFITIGNFRNKSNSTYQCVNSGAINPYAYYYMDDVSVTLGSCNVVLSNELTDYYAYSLTDENIIIWETSSETNSDYYTIESSPNTLEWTVLGHMPTEGNTTSASRYSWTDKEPHQLTYYRLKETSIDGKSSYSETISVQNTALQEGLSVLVSPNPANNFFHFMLGEDFWGKELNVEIKNADGKIVSSKYYSQYSELKEYTIETSDLKNGMYLLTFTSDNLVIIDRVIIAR